MRNRALALLAEAGPIHTASHASDIKGKHQVVYLVLNGPNVMQIGKGSMTRMKSVMRGSLACKHNKAFICAAAEVVFGHPNEYHYVIVRDKQTAAETETRIHAGMGIQTNRAVATWIEGETMTSVIDTHRWLCDRARQSDAYRRLSPVEQQMLEELFDLMTDGTTEIKRTSRTVRSCQGDNLEGNILMRINKRYLINVFELFSNNYLRYGRHRLSPEEFEQSKIGYSYQVTGQPFTVRA